MPKKLTDGYVVQDEKIVDRTLGALQQLWHHPAEYIQLIGWCQGRFRRISRTTILLLEGRHLLKESANNLYAPDVPEDIKHIVCCAGGPPPHDRILDPETGQPLTRKVRSGQTHLNQIKETNHGSHT